MSKIHQSYVSILHTTKTKIPPRKSSSCTCCCSIKLYQPVARLFQWRSLVIWRFPPLFLQFVLGKNRNTPLETCANVSCSCRFSLLKLVGVLFKRHGWFVGYLFCSSSLWLVLWQFMVGSWPAPSEALGEAYLGICRWQPSLPELHLPSFLHPT